MGIKSALASGLLLIAAHAPAASPGLTIVSEAIQPQLAIDDAGNMYAVFIHQGNIAVSASRDRGKSFGEPVVAIDSKGRASGGSQRGPRIGVDRKKNVFVTAPVVFDEAEYKKKYPTAEIYLVSSADGGKSWTKPLQVNEVSKKAPESLHWLAVAPSGETHVAWLDIRSRKDGQDLYYAKVANGKVGKNLQIANNVCNCCAPGIAVDGRGNPLVAFREGGSKPSRAVYAVYSTNEGRSFGKAVQLNKRPTNEAG